VDEAEAVEEEEDEAEEANPQAQTPMIAPSPQLI
jgi:hypothetical protein